MGLFLVSGGSLPISVCSVGRGIKADFYLLLCSIAWGGTYIAIKASLAEIDTITLMTLRMTGTALLFWLWNTNPRKSLRPEILRSGIILGLLMFASFSLQTAGLVWTGVSRSAFISGFFVVFTAFFSWLLHGKPFRHGTLAGVALVTCGLYLFTGLQSIGSFNAGDWLTFLSAAGFGLHITLLDRYSRLSLPDLRMMITIQISACAILSWMAFPFFSSGARPGPDATLGLMFLIVPGTLMVAYLQGRYQKETTPTRAALIFALEPVFAAIGGFFFYKEIPGLLQYAGALLMIGGTLVSEVFRYKESQEEP